MGGSGSSTGNTGNTGNTGKGYTGGRGRPDYGEGQGQFDKTSASYSSSPSQSNAPQQKGSPTPFAPVSFSSKSASDSMSDSMAIAVSALSFLGGSMLAGPVSGAYIADATYKSALNGWVGDSMNIRSQEAKRDFLETKNFSRDETKAVIDFNNAGSLLDDTDLSDFSGLGDVEDGMGGIT